MRRPSDRAALWARWHERLAQQRAGDLAFRKWPFEEPQCGRYQAKRHGQYVGVQIDIEQHIDRESGELTEPERLVAFVQGERFDDFERVVAIWQRCGNKPVSDEEFKRLLRTPRIDNLGEHSNHMSVVEDRPPAIGDNSADPHAISFAEMEARLNKFIEAAEVWEKRKPDDTDEDLAARANDFLTGARKLFKDADTARTAAKKPHDDAARAVQGQWKPLLDKIEKVGAIVKPHIASFLRREEARKAADRKKAEQAAREAEEAARAQREAAASAGTVSERLAAEEAAEQHEAVATHAQQRIDDANEKPRAASATGLGSTRSLRTVRTPRITSLPAALAHYREESELTALILKLAARDLREAPTLDGAKQIPTIPGIAWDTEQKV